MKLFLHFIENGKEDAPIDTYIAKVEPTFTVSEILKLAVINCRKELDASALKLFKQFGADPLENGATVEASFKENDDVFIIYSSVKPLKVEKNSTEIFETITKYSFADETKKVQ